MEVDTVKLFRYVTKADTAVLGLEIVLMVMLLYYTATELIELRRLGKRYFRDPWNYIDWANYAILYAVVILRFLSWSVIEDSDFRALQETYVDFPSLVDWANKELKLMAFNFFLIYFKFFKYLSNVPRMDAILVTISACLFDLTLFMIMAVIILLGFLAAFFIVFGPYLAEFSTAGKTLRRVLATAL